MYEEDCRGLLESAILDHLDNMDPVLERNRAVRLVYGRLDDYGLACKCLNALKSSAKRHEDRGGRPLCSTVFELMQAFDRQNGACAVCGVFDRKGYGLNADHDHVTGAFRGWLCGRCNGCIVAKYERAEKKWGIGLEPWYEAADTREKAAIDYLGLTPPAAQVH